MKKQIYTAAASLFTLSAMAQPTLNKVEDYTAGTKIKALNCQAIAAGTAGANQTWNFSALTGTDTTTFTYLANPASSPFPAANLVEKSSDSTYRFFNKTAAATYTVGITDSSSTSDNAMISYSNTALAMQRPLTYNATASDSFAHTITNGMFTIYGKGEVQMKVDGYGTLVLPNGTYNNVLRVRMETNQKDSIGIPGNLTFITQLVSYAWYDNAHKAPLLRIDSNDVSGSADVAVSYLLKEDYPVGIASISAKNIEFYAFFNGNMLDVNGAFESGKPYDLNVLDLAGRSIHAETFIASGAEKHLTLQNDAPAGIYIISVRQSDGSAGGFIKVAKDH
ncbi:hypothetical protein [Polluticoccus soli]|uniref:hypothetical protein n=1 Tax=Polluticoccus soli TaxID=3034150 RepID=UPI0023E10899|nr:hypothetical protein [Flavipsychrobacter sp. JY13-12]